MYFLLFNKVCLSRVLIQEDLYGWDGSQERGAHPNPLDCKQLTPTAR